MSWYGSHPKYSKAIIRSLLPPRACKSCVYWFRVVIGSSPERWHFDTPSCQRCGIPTRQLLAELNQIMLGCPLSEFTRASALPSIRRPSTKTNRPTIGEQSSSLEKWIGLYRSKNQAVRIRAARILLHREDLPLWILLDLLNSHLSKYIGVNIEDTLLSRNDPELVDEMIGRLNSEETWMRELACRALGRMGGRRSTPHLLRCTRDSNIMVRRSAIIALGQLGDRTVIPQLRQMLEELKCDDVNFVLAIQTALRDLESCD